MRPTTPYEHIYSRRERLVSSFAAVPAFSGLVLRGSNRPREGNHSPETFHFSRIEKGDHLAHAMARHQHMLFSQLSLRPGKTVLDLACGNGSASRQLVQFADVNVVGIDTDSHLISSARISAEAAGLTTRISYYHVGDVCEALANFPDGSFDAVFGIELAYRIVSPKTLYQHVERILKPSGKFAIYEWCLTDTMSFANAEHVAAVQGLLRSFPKTAQDRSLGTITDVTSNVRAAGLVNVAASDLSLRRAGIPWYHPLEDHQSSRSNPSVSLSWWYKQLPIGALLTAGYLRIFSPMVLVTGEKLERPPY